MRNPNRFGSVVKLSGQRRRPYMVRTGVYAYDDRGYPQFKIIGYTATREDGIIMLSAYNKNPWDVEGAKTTLQRLFELWKEKKAPKLGSNSSRKGLISAYNHCKGLAALPYRDIRAHQMQACIDGCGKTYATQAAIKNLWGHLDRFALELDIVSKCYSTLLTSAPVPPTSRRPFTEDEIKTLWAHAHEPWVDTVLIFIYTGWRISELLALTPGDIDLAAGTMTGGTKTAAGKNRTVPIHSKIRPFIEARLSEGGPALLCHDGRPMSSHHYRAEWAGIMANLGMNHTPHECRHTFETRMDAAGANRRCIDLIMGHTSTDTGNRIYNHKTLADLTAAIELLN